VIIGGNVSLDDHHQFAGLKQTLRSNEFKNNYEVKTVVTRRLITRTTDCCEQGTEQLVLRYDKCLLVVAVG
jgi:hypothetical protein